MEGETKKYLSIFLQKPPFSFEKAAEGKGWQMTQKYDSN